MKMTNKMMFYLITFILCMTSSLFAQNQVVRGNLTVKGNIYDKNGGIVSAGNGSSNILADIDWNMTVRNLTVYTNFSAATGYLATIIATNFSTTNINKYLYSGADGRVVGVDAPAGTGSSNVFTFVDGIGVRSNLYVSNNITILGTLTAPTQTVAVLNVSGAINFTEVSSGILNTTNGIIFYAVDNIPTNLIPISTATHTNYVLVNWTNTGPVFVATNIASAGSFILATPGITMSVWP